MLRVTSTKEYTRLRGSSAKVITKYFLIIYLPESDAGRCSAGITVSRKIGNAVTRNRVKRRVKAFIQNLDMSACNYPFICNIIALPTVVDASWLSICEDLKKALQKVQVNNLKGILK